jgi:nitrate reductase (cytochrome), electron transfer subunit
MKMLFRFLIVLACLIALAIPVLADEKDDDFAKDALTAEGTPPMVPHGIDDRTGEACLACHRTGLNGAPQSPHPERLDCTECHGQGEITVKLKDSKHEKKSKKKHKETHKDHP